MAVAVIILFIGIAIAPSINANVNRQALVEFTTEVCGLDGGKQTVKLTQEETEELIQLFRSIEERLNKSDSMEEAVEIFDEAILELDRFGVLPNDMSVKDVQRLVTGRFKNPIMTRIFEGIENRQKRPIDADSNFFCLIAGSVDCWYFLFFNLLHNFMWTSFPLILLALFGFGVFFIMIGLSPIYLTLFAIDLLNPFCVGRAIRSLEEGKGMVVAFGLNGLKTWKNEMIGAIDHWHPFFEDFFLPAWVIGFTGIKIQVIYDYDEEKMLSLFIGFAPWVKIKELD